MTDEPQGLDPTRPVGPPAPPPQTDKAARIAYDGQGLGPMGAWNCPACGVLQTHPFGSAPCTNCGAGAPPQKAAPPAPRAPRRDVPHIDEAFLQTAGRAVNAWEVWFADFARQYGGVVNLSFLEPLLREAFMAGAVSGHRAEPSRKELTFSSGGARARTLAAALKMFVDQILVESTEQVESGEWLSVAQAQALIAQFELEGME